MSGLGEYAFTNAKVRGMLSYLLTDSQLDSLVSAKGVEEFLQILKNTAYYDIFKRLSPSYDPKDIELEFVKDGIKKHKKIIKGMAGKPKKVAAMLLSRYEVSVLRNILRVWYSHGQEKDLRYIYKDKIYYDIPLTELANSKTIEEIIVLLDKTPYSKALINGRPAFKQKGSLFYLESALVIDYYKRLQDEINKLDRIDRRQASRLVGIEIDIENINWIIRFKQYYKMPSAELSSYIIPYGYRLAEPLVRNAYMSNDVISLIKSLSVKPYQDIFTLIDSVYNKENVFMLEIILWQLFLKETRAGLGKYPFTISTVIAYLVLYRIEVKNIICLIYSKLYELDGKRIKENLVC